MTLRSALLSLATLLSACSAYQRDFREAAAELPDPPPNALGAWKGSWHSEPSGHRGPLWCVVTPAEGGGHDFRYRAGWGAFQFGDYTHHVEAELAADGSLAVTGEMELPGGFGTYTIDGRLTATEFKARFTSDRGDRGTMTLSRPK